MKIKIVGGGLAGCEAAFYLLKKGFHVDLYEMRPLVFSPAHRTSKLCELVCSNSLKSISLHTGQGLLKEEMRILDSLVLYAAERSKVPAGESLSVDRGIFQENIEKILFSFPKFNLINQEITDLSENSIIATGPLTSSKLSQAIINTTGKENFHFFDAISPIISGESINMKKAFFGTRYGKGSPDFINCPLSKEEYISFHKELVDAKTVILKEFEKRELFNSCLPIEEIARSGIDSMRFGPLRPVGLTNDVFGKSYAVVQLRKENIEGDSYNIVGFQTNLKYPEQNRVFQLIPALENCEFIRYGAMHRNNYLDSPKLLSSFGNLLKNPSIFFAGQIIGVEGYMESAASGIVAAINISRFMRKECLIDFPKNTIIGALMKYVSQENNNFQPMNANFGLFPSDSIKYKDKSQRKDAIVMNSLKNVREYVKLLEV
ncbi:MAG: methylenetetrahydrofolate--tRNA-(uracil(54)-C(5))-methyltransferase (FADH(2)-oxidizing) TrmFO [Clostridia bacterium]|jgi:methylenetetrahydrofolate--tRNA-(uracil-5-)-methyltransferase|nr:methylenetetrahydrofolate--tRNA-(uracil(54)-C(5))-methyltransferase (FADH(2)-oxidizing) TrmFO [Clostridia bacterium]